MKTNYTRTELKKMLAQLDKEHESEKRNAKKEFQKIINQLISETPTGELRNTYTDLNVLFHFINEE